MNLWRTDSPRNNPTKHIVASKLSAQFGSVMTPRELAVQVTVKLQNSGCQALWAGGCVRDGLLGIAPKDFDVATSATPNEVQGLFGVNKTLEIGKSFGVITVIGPKSAGNIEIATFRRDGGYSDGRRPDSIEFTDAKEDALRRDFTINGMFYDPVSDEVIDYVGGKADLEQKLIRAIGDADQRIEEDRLRMLRGVRFAATYGFEIEAATMAAIQKRAADIEAVSPERIGTELRRMFTHHGRARALRLLVESGLWDQVLPEKLHGFQSWDERCSLLDQLDSDFPTILAALFSGTDMSASELQDRWRLTNEEVTKTNWILDNEASLSVARDLRWSQLQPLLISKYAKSAVDLLQAKIDAGSDAGQRQTAVTLCREKLSLEPSVLNPEPLLCGKDLMELNMAPGPQFKSILDRAREMQLDGELATAEQARGWAAGSRD